jgi:hypothetical protein
VLGIAAISFYFSRLVRVSSSTVYEQKQNSAGFNTHLMLLHFTDRFKGRESRDFLVVHFYNRLGPGVKGCGHMNSYIRLQRTSANLCQKKFIIPPINRLVIEAR